MIQFSMSKLSQHKCKTSLCGYFHPFYVAKWKSFIFSALIIEIGWKYNCQNMFTAFHITIKSWLKVDCIYNEVSLISDPFKMFILELKTPIVWKQSFIYVCSKHHISYNSLAMLCKTGLQSNILCLLKQWRFYIDVAVFICNTVFIYKNQCLFINTEGPVCHLDINCYFGSYI